MTGAASLVLEPRDDAVLLVTINRPAARNALSAEVWEGLIDTLATAVRDGSRAIVLTGAGEYFCAGGDMKSPPSDGTGAFSMVYRLQLAHQAMAQIAVLPIPVIAAVEGGAAGLGWGLALACDMIFASRDARFIAPFIARGVVPDGGIGQVLIRTLGRQRTTDLLLSGNPLSAEDAHLYGLVARLTSPGAAVADALAYAARMPTGAGKVVEMTKRLLRSAEDVSRSVYLEQELALAALCQLGPAAAAARESFRDKDGK